MAERTCIVTREVHDPAQLIRFVVGPDKVLFPDIRNKLPGRGVWVLNRKEVVQQAAEKKLFARSLKSSVTVNDGLPDQVNDLLTQDALNALGLCRKAGKCISGSGKVETAIRGGKVEAVLHALDGADDGLGKIKQAVRVAERDWETKVPIWRIFESTQMNLALGASNVIHAALMKGGATQNCLRGLRRLADYQGMEPS